MMTKMAVCQSKSLTPKSQNKLVNREREIERKREREGERKMEKVMEICCWNRQGNIPRTVF